MYFHELAHAVHHQYLGFDKDRRAEAEIIAETAAAVLCQIQGITGYESQAYEYLQDYTQQMKETDVLKVIISVLSDVEKIVVKILELAAA